MSLTETPVGVIHDFTRQRFEPENSAHMVLTTFSSQPIFGQPLVSKPFSRQGLGAVSTAVTPKPH